MKEGIKILIIEDELLVAMDLEETLLRLGYQVVGAAHNVALAKKLLSEKRPDLVLCDVNLNDAIDGITLMSELRKQYTFIVIFLTAFHDNATLARAMEVGLSNYIVKPFQEPQLRVTLQMAIEQHRPKEQALRQLLSPKEIQVLELLYRGKSPQEIADELSNSYQTIATHTKSLRKKLCVKSSLDLVALVAKNRWFDP
ncbi:two component transcriptional regulator, luxr family protein [Nitritalea halalkaliphila LW7]|uniref:Two component transcriptional regulator, luxr family protein n=1 Tax=Nitritalea halalkaliphila LW7 TaxID=1189621 RepID=I5BTX5_9BACT|nr:response regulator transcription factor [Nitritalea halalkaliphila]EIM73027.1 two component transcriptional regulator, luxr family protein [Nitritalea halalkaliphila LW7]